MTGRYLSKADYPLDPSTGVCPCLCRRLPGLCMQSSDSWIPILELSLLSASDNITAYCGARRLSTDVKEPSQGTKHTGLELSNDS